MDFPDGATYYTKSTFSAFPATYEATVFLSGDILGRSGLILGNYVASETGCVRFEIHANGVPGLYFVDNNDTVYDYKFTDINVHTGKWVHIAIVTDSANSKLHCYIDGVLKQTLSGSIPQSMQCNNNLAMGGDSQLGSTKCFKGNILDIVIYEDMRTADEISVDFSSGEIDKDGLVAGYDLSVVGDEEYPHVISDISGNSMDLFKSPWWITDKEPVSDYAYSFAVIGDIQRLTYFYPENLSNIYDWLVDNAEEKRLNLHFVWAI